jgi:hypothetical protein
LLPAHFLFSTSGDCWSKGDPSAFMAGTRMNNSLITLNAINFFMADVQGGLGPYLGVFLQVKNWSPSQIGAVMTIGGLAGMVATAPLGTLVDRVQAKRFMVAVAALATVAGSLVILFMPSFWATTVAQAATGIAGAAIPPAIAGITFGLVKQKGFPHQIGRNEAFNHTGIGGGAALRRPRLYVRAGRHIRGDVGARRPVTGRACKDQSERDRSRCGARGLRQTGS